MEKFKRSLEENQVEELTSGYRLDFIRKNIARKQSGERPTTVIVPDKEHNEKAENQDSKNLFFTGDNLEVLRHLQQNYTKSIDVIYIDPPYNTGSDGFVYSDKFEYSDDTLQNMFNLTDEELQRLKSIQGKSTHSAWLTFMYPRLYLAKKLLKDTGVIFVSIDDNEQANLKLLMDEVFGETNFVASLAIENNPKGRKNGKFVSINHEYLHIYTKNIYFSNSFKNVVKKNDLSKDEIGYYSHGKRILVGESTNPVAHGGEKDYSVYINRKDLILKTEQYDEIDRELISKGYKVYKSIKNGTVLENTYTKKKFQELFDNNSLLFKKDSIYEKDRNIYKQQKSLINSTDEWDLKTETAAFVYKGFDSKKLFSMPKNPNYIKMLLSMVGDDNLCVLDFFAGSSTTADAVMQLNAEDGGKRQFIMCTLPEPTYTVNSDGKKVPTKGGAAAYQAGYQSIDQISRARIEKAAEKIKSENPEKAKVLDLGFKHYRVVSPKLETLEKLEFDDSLQLDLFDDMLDDFSAQSLGLTGGDSGGDTLFHTYLASDGYKFDVPVEMVDFSGIELPYVNQQRLYLIRKDWKAENTKALVNQIGTNQLNVQTLVIYGHILDMASLRELEIACDQLDNKINILVRY
ncbi:site-specific DNA-methyltransferase [Streptococcus sciuri]|uniref:site-specific DNA-methyltransferase n=1 Tax=Streptococcus sciuri TaxID=2973939 RepID=UPI0021D5C645